MVACQGCFKCTQLHIHTSAHRQVNCCSETLFFWKFSERTLFKALGHLQSFLAAFTEQVQNIEQSKVSLVKFVSCFAPCEGKDSIETSKCTYQAKLNEH